MSTLSPVRIKICGLCRPQDVRAVNAVLPDYAGFVFAPSKRQVLPEQARELSQALDSSIGAVGVFVNAPPEEIIALYQQGVIQIAQLHGSEDSAYIAFLKQRVPQMPIIKAYFASGAADYLLLDNLEPGSGKPFATTLDDWRALSATIAASALPVFLAGGIDSDNIAQALALTPAPFCIDVSSGAETDGVKDAHKIARLVAAVRNADR